MVQEEYNRIEREKYLYSSSLHGFTHEEQRVMFENIVRSTEGTLSENIEEAVDNVHVDLGVNLYRLLPYVAEAEEQGMLVGKETDIISMLWEGVKCFCRKLIDKNLDKIKTNIAIDYYKHRSLPQYEAMFNIRKEVSELGKDTEVGEIRTIVERWVRDE